MHKVHKMMMDCVSRDGGLAQNTSMITRRLHVKPARSGTLQGRVSSAPSTHALRRLLCGLR